MRYRPSTQHEDQVRNHAGRCSFEMMPYYIPSHLEWLTMALSLIIVLVFSKTLPIFFLSDSISLCLVRANANFVHLCKTQKIHIASHLPFSVTICKKDGSIEQSILKKEATEASQVTVWLWPWFLMQRCKPKPSHNMYGKLQEISFYCILLKWWDAVSNVMRPHLDHYIIIHFQLDFLLWRVVFCYENHFLSQLTS